MAKDDRGWRETRHLLGNPRNAERLRRSIRAADAGVLAAHPLCDPAAQTHGESTTSSTDDPAGLRQ